MIQIYIEQISERLIYTLNFVFKERGVQFRVNNDFQTFSNSDGIKLNYSEREFENVLQIKPSTLLFDEAIFNYSIDKSNFGEEECLSFNSISDPLASIFYILSRMEEYYNFIEDQHGRFSSKSSVLSKYNWLDRVVCDRWSMAVIEALEDFNNITITCKPVRLELIPSFDIDNTYAFKLKKGPRKWLSIFRDILQGNKNRIEERKKVNLGESKDPYDTYSYIESISERGFDVHVFWLVGEYGRFDKNISLSDVRHQDLIQRMSESTTLGLHPSYNSNTLPSILSNEKDKLEAVLGHQIACSRNHFLKMKIHSTYNNLLRLGFKQDFTMGFADAIGFRAGTARPFQWFDLEKNKLTDLIINPFAYMDGTLNEYLKLTPEVSKMKIYSLFKEVEKFGGNFIFIWHNETIGDYGKWKGWRTVLEYSLDLKREKK
jgi:hypothetical protein